MNHLKTKIGAGVKPGDSVGLIFAPQPYYVWGLRPDWLKSGGLPNVRVEKVRQGTWSGYSKALLQIQSFFVVKGNQWYEVSAEGLMVLCIYHSNTFAIVTREAYGELAKLSERMPQLIRIGDKGKNWYPAFPKLTIKLEVEYIAKDSPC